MSDGDSGSGGSRKHRRKRLAKSSPFSPSHHPYSSDEDIDKYSICRNLSDIDAVRFLSSPFKTWQVISSFTPVKKELVQSMGFGGLLSLPCIKTENKAFNFWLLSHVKWYTTTLFAGDKISLTLHPAHIGKITGLSTCGEVIPEKYIQNLDDKSNFMRTNLSFLSSERGLLEAAETFVQKDFTVCMSKEETDNFKIAFLIFVIGRFLAPSTEHPDGSTDFWGTLEHPDAIVSYNWSSYVYANLKKAARLVNWSTPQNTALKYVIGCSLIMQIFYLDNVDFGELNLQHEILPRWTIYSDTKINAMVAADTKIALVGSSTNQFGRIQVLREGITCYILNQEDLLQITSSATPPCPPVYPLRQRHSPNDLSRTPDHSDDDTGHPMDIVTSVQPVLSTETCFDKEVADFNAFICNKYQGQVEPKFLEDMKSHNSRCLAHLAKSYRSLAQAIVNENAHLASSFFEHSQKRGPPIPNVPMHINSHQRRRRQTDMHSGPDSSTDGEDNTLRSKMAGQIIPLCSSTASSSRSKTNQCTSNTTMSLHVANDGISPMQWTNTATLTPMMTIPLDSSSPLINFSPNLNQSYSRTPVHNAEELPCLTSSGMHSNPIPHAGLLDNNSIPGSSHLSAFATPEATIKMTRFAEVSYTPTGQTDLSGQPLANSLPARMNSQFCGSFPKCEIPAEESNLQVPKKIVPPRPICLSHFAMNLSYPQNDPISIDLFYQWLSATDSEELRSTWLMHSIPRVLKILGNEMKDQFVANNTMSCDVFDASIRRLAQIDSYIYSNDPSSRWRHLLESDFANEVLRSSNPSYNNSVREQFTGRAVTYDISTCQMIYIPAFIGGSWRCYVLDVVSSSIFIIDPAAHSRKDDVVINKHVPTIKQLFSALSSTISDLFNGWAPNQTPSKYFLVRIPGMPYSSRASGIFTLFCIWYFDGTNVTVLPDKTNIGNFKAYLVNQLLHFQLNSAQPPTTFIGISPSN